MSIDYAELEAWFKERPQWLQDAARRLFQTGDITLADAADLLVLCKREAGVAVADKPDLVPAPIPGAALRVTGTGVPLRITTISDVQGINALAPRSPLGFGDKHLTVVYGHNGSGKSGYIRILKHLCGGRGLRTLHKNVFDKAQVDQRCKVRYTHGTTDKELSWTPKDGTHPDLSSISLFDSDCANVYINDENQIAYEPTLLCYFRKLAETCDELAAKLKAEVAAKVSAKPALPTEYAQTPTAVWYGGINRSTTAQAITEQCTWTEANDTELTQLAQRLAESNPAEKARALRKLKTHVLELHGILDAARTANGDDALDQLVAARASALTARRAADAAAKTIFDGAPLKGIASDTWQLLWEKARAYSEAVAYPGQPFPVVTGDARCVLCQQELAPAAAARMVSFEEFVKGTLESDAKAADTALQGKLALIKDIPQDADLDARLDVAGISDESLRAAIRVHCRQLKKRRDFVATAAAKEQAPPLPAPDVEQKLTAIAASHETAAAAFDEDAKQDNKKELSEKVKSLRAKKWLAEQKVAVEAEVARLKEVALLEAAQRLTNTSSLSTKKSSLSELLITADFIARFEQELKFLSAAHLRVTIEKTGTRKGQVWHRIALKDSTLPVMTKEVLSEGELRVVSIAAFLADVAINQDNATFVFDDPISSLDQDYEECTAYRLASMSKTRQVIIFTHRLSLLHLVENAADKSGVECHVVSLQRQSWGAGEPGEPPLPSQKPAKALNSLLGERLSKVRKIFTEVGKDEYQLHAKALCSDIRITMERLIENDLLADVVQRFRRPINTMGKIEKLAKISAEDCKLFDELMTKYSRYEHAQPDEAPVLLPEPDELDGDLKRLKAWLDGFNARPVPVPA
jgi:energy-coupling factor transporter ATP-binding protein EcfA2